MKIVEYKLLTCQSTIDLNKEVNEYLERGWKLRGETHISKSPGSPIYFYQAMVREEN